MSRQRRSQPPVPRHRDRPLFVAADEPVEVLDAAYGLAVLLLPPAPGPCSCCDQDTDRLVLHSRRCSTCDRYCRPDGCEVAA